MTDGSTLEALHTRAFGHSGAHGWRQTDFERAVEDTSHVICCEPIGYALSRVILDEAELLLIATVPEARRRGVATSLWQSQEAKLRARGVARVFLEVVESNTAALRFYEKHGFFRVGKRPEYYGQGPGHGAVLMEKTLK